MLGVKTEIYIIFVVSQKLVALYMYHVALRHEGKVKLVLAAIASW